MIIALVNLVIYLVVVGLLYWLAQYVITHLAFPEPVGRVLNIVIVVLFVLVVIAILLNFIGLNLGLPRLS